METDDLDLSFLDSLGEPPAELPKFEPQPVPEGTVERLVGFDASDIAPFENGVMHDEPLDEYRPVSLELIYETCERIVTLLEAVVTTLLASAPAAPSSRSASRSTRSRRTPADTEATSEENASD